MFVCFPKTWAGIGARAGAGAGAAALAAGAGVGSRATTEAVALLFTSGKGEEKGTWATGPFSEQLLNDC
jgi:hypothetical protein